MTSSSRDFDDTLSTFQSLYSTFESTMSDPSSSTPTGQSSKQQQPKQPKQPKTPTSASNGGEGSAAAAGGSSSAPKQKSAKELKKEKRAAMVSARGGGGGAGGEDASEGQQNPKLRPGPKPSIQTGSTAQIPQHAPTLRRAGTGLPSQSTDQLSAQALFVSHLPPHSIPDTPSAFNTNKLHPEIIRLGVMMSNGSIRGSNARTMAMMAAFQEVIRDYECPDQVDLWKDLPIYLSPMIAWLEGCRPKGVGGGNAIRWLKSEINRLGEGDERTVVEQKAYLVEAIGVYIRDRIEFADQVIADNAKEKIQPGETIVTYARSSIVERVILEAWRDMKETDPEATFEVVVVDSRPLNEGKALLHSLTAAGVQCTYVLLTQVSTVLQRASLVLLGASALHSDGALFARSGTAIVSMLAKEHKVPVVACVETYKFGERVVLDGVASNELGDAQVLFDIPANKAVGVKKPVNQALTPLCLMYDLTPPNLITAVCTEIGFIPPSSVPTVLGKANGVVA